MLDESEVDRVVDCQPEAVCECGGQVELASEPQRHQVFEVPPMRAQVDEYRLYSGRCAGCGKAHAGVLPPGVPRGQLGPRALSLVAVSPDAAQDPQPARSIDGLELQRGYHLPGAWQGGCGAQGIRGRGVGIAVPGKCAVDGRDALP